MPLAARCARRSCVASMSTKTRGARDCEVLDRSKTPSTACASDTPEERIALLPELRPSGALAAIGLRRHSQLRSHASVAERTAACKSSADAMPGRDNLRLGGVHAAGALLHPACRECLVLRVAKQSSNAFSLSGGRGPPVDCARRKSALASAEKALLNYVRHF